MHLLPGTKETILSFLRAFRNEKRAISWKYVKMILNVDNAEWKFSLNISKQLKILEYFTHLFETFHSSRHL